MEKKIPTYELVIDENDITPIDVLSFVDRPAIEKDFVFFCTDCIEQKQKKEFSFDKYKGIVVSPVLIPNKLIYRYNKSTNKEYNVFLSEQTIEDVSKKFLTYADKQKAFSIMHNGKTISGVKLIESWITEHDGDKANSIYGLDVPKGTWMAKFDVNENPELLSLIVNGNINGISIEGLFLEKLSQKFAIEPKEDETKDEFISRCIATEIDNGYPQDQAVAICYSKWEEEYFNQMEKEMIEMDKQLGKEFFAKTYLLESYSNYPLAVSDNAKKAIERNEANGNRCGTLVSRKIAQQLANRRPISYITIRRMFSYLSRNFNLYKENEVNSCNNISFNLLGGNEALRWSERIIRQVEDNIRNERE